MATHPSQPDTKGPTPPPLTTPLARNITTTKAWDGVLNKHQTYASISVRKQDIRDRHLATIAHQWGTRDPHAIFPPTLRPRGLPSTLRDFSTEMLEALAALAKLTRGDVERAQHFMRAAPADRGGWRGAALGDDDIWRACVQVEIDEARKSWSAESKATSMAAASPKSGTDEASAGLDIGETQSSQPAEQGKAPAAKVQDAASKGRRSICTTITYLFKCLLIVGVLVGLAWVFFL